MAIVWPERGVGRGVWVLMACLAVRACWMRDWSSGGERSAIERKWRGWRDWVERRRRAGRERAERRRVEAIAVVEEVGESDGGER